MKDDYVETIEELINRKQQQMLVHSCIYYRFNQNLISDSTFDSWAMELVELQNDHPLVSVSTQYGIYFQAFDGTTGNHLPLNLPEVIDRPLRVLRSTKVERKRLGI